MEEDERGVFTIDAMKIRDDGNCKKGRDPRCSIFLTTVGEQRGQ